MVDSSGRIAGLAHDALDKKYSLRSGAVAALLKVSTVTIRRWADDGTLPYIVLEGGKHRWFAFEDVEELRKVLAPHHFVAARARHIAHRAAWRNMVAAKERAV